jgi:signal transduction histidine kinase
MKIAEKLFYLIAVTGFVLKPFHIPGHTLIILCGLLMLFIFYLYILITSAKPITYVLTGMSAVFVMASVLCHLKFFLFASYIMDFSAFILLLAVFYSIRKKTYFWFLSSFVLFWVGIHVFILTQPRYKLYYFLNIRFNRHIEQDYLSWDKYSWFLYIEEKYDSALNANKQATQIAKTLNDTAFYKQALEHRKLIEKRKWQSFHKK